MRHHFPILSLFTIPSSWLGTRRICCHCRSTFFTYPIHTRNISLSNTFHITKLFRLFFNASFRLSGIYSYLSSDLYSRISFLASSILPSYINASAFLQAYCLCFYIPLIQSNSSSPITLINAINKFRYILILFLRMLSLFSKNTSKNRFPLFFTLQILDSFLCLFFCNSKIW